ncbi:hypothetical protein [Methylocystis sp.]|uniref:hypothetical protein n=1 Tax=Methylocystis sp. TaxID=1911079 RepID=UPI003DA3E5F0
MNKRLSEPGTIDWALKLKSTQRIERIAVSDLLNSPGARVLDNPWATAWRLIEESWCCRPSEEEPTTAIYGIQKRLRAGDRSGAIVSAIVELVAPRLKVEPIDSGRWQFIKKPRRPKTFNDLLTAGLTSGNLIDLNVLELANLMEVPFLDALANALEAAVDHGLDIARRTGWNEKRSLFHMGSLDRVYYIQDSSRADQAREPDAFHHGIAPSVKLLYAVVARMAELDNRAASRHVQSWRLVGSSVHVRLWAATARNSQLAAADEMGAFLVGLDDRQFWDLQVYPEIAELRALRFGDLSPETRNAIAQRLRKGPPRDHWPKKADATKVKNARLYSAVRELKRIHAAGGHLPQDARKWMEANIAQFANLATMAIDDGFPEGVTVYFVPAHPDARYDTLDGVRRLRALETALSTSRGGWDDDPAERANDWLQVPGNSALILNDFKSTGDGGDDFPHVWNRFGWASSPTRQPEPAETPQRDLQIEADRVLILLAMLSEKTISNAIEGISAWLDAWRKQVVVSPSGLAVWQRVWPIAAEATDAIRQEENDANLSVSVRASEEDREPMDLDTLNTPAGKLVGVFLSACPLLTKEPTPFAAESAVRQMRDTVIRATGRSGLIARHRMIEYLPYFLHADRDWTQEHLIAPLLRGDGASLALWRAIARSTHSADVLKIIGGVMTERATDSRLGRETRQRLVFSLVVESMHAFRENREPAVPNPRIQQMLRTIDDEVRAAAANAIQQFVAELSKKLPAEENAPSAADLFRSAAVPFLRDVWPQERSLATPGVSGALTDLPATSGEAFAEAVESIHRFLVPFNCWSMIDYGLYGDDGGKKKLTVINDEAKAQALLRLLNLTVGSSEGDVIPYDLTDALDQIQSVAPALVEHPAFRRLSTAARR